MSLSLYIHYPFCLRKCLYCAFNSREGQPRFRDEYPAALLREMEIRRHMPREGAFATTLYFGGGTPSLMEPSHVERIIRAAEKLYSLSPNAEITLECNPGTVTEEKLAAFRKAGINRLSLGMQSLDNAFLKKLGRIHTAEEALSTFSAARKAGFANVGIDLIHSLPGQTLLQWKRELERVLPLNPEHLSVYGLTIEEGTPFACLEKEGNLSLPHEEIWARMYEKTSGILENAGYEQYEISNFARPGFQSRHNSGYWRRRPFLGFGAGAHSHLRDSGSDIRSSNIESPEDYLQTLSEGTFPTAESRCISREEAMAESLFLGLRMSEGINLERFRKEFSVSFQEAYGSKCSDLFAARFLEIRNGFLRLAPKARILSNRVFVRFL